MSPIINASALHGLSNHALDRLRASLREALSCGHSLNEGDRCQFCVALATIEGILRSRAAPRPPAPRPRF